MASSNISTTSKRKRSEVWKYFNVKETNTNYAMCTFCKCSISRGCSKGSGTQSYTTTNMMKHLKTFHQRDIENCEEDVDDPAGLESTVGMALDRPRPSPPTEALGIQDAISISKPSSSNVEPEVGTSKATIGNTVLIPSVSKPTRPTPTLKVGLSRTQPTLSQVFEKTKQFNSTHSRAIKITSLIAEMICTDNQPISIVENPGFRRLLQFLEPRYTIPGRKHFSSTVIPSIYDKVINKIKNVSDKAEYISITTDMWSSTANVDYMSLTAHFLTEDMEQVHICLDVIPFPYESHNAANIAKFINDCLQQWGLLA